MTAAAPVLVWASLLPYHFDRIEAVRREFGADAVLLSIAASGSTYGGIQAPYVNLSGVDTIFPNKAFDEIPVALRIFGLLRALLKHRKRPLFLCHYHCPEVFFSAVLLRLLGCKVFTMQDSRFRDRRRFVFRELLKVFLYMPYHGALCSGPETKEYLRFLGFRRRPIAYGFDTLSLARIEQQAEVPEEHGAFVFVGRFVEKKNVPCLLRAYRGYVARCLERPIPLRLVGDGPLRPTAEAYVAKHGLRTVKFLGFCDTHRVSSELAGARALLLPSLSDEWGLVVNEALAFNLPCIVSEAVGARSLLVKDNVNGFVLEPDNIEGWAEALLKVGHDDALVARFRDRAREFRDLADITAFVKGIRELIEAV